MTLQTLAIFLIIGIALFGIYWVIQKTCLCKHKGYDYFDMTDEEGNTYEITKKKEAKNV
jgi:hypothetical protein